MYRAFIKANKADFLGDESPALRLCNICISHSSDITQIIYRWISCKNGIKI